MFAPPDCQNCPALCKSRTQVVNGVGPYAARVAIVGEAPGREEDAAGSPFIGRSGQLLRRTLGELGIDPTRDVFYTNVVRCRPEDNRDPTPDEMRSCTPFLRDELRALAPRSILAVGRIAASVLGHMADNGMRSPATQVYHPAYILRNPSKRLAWKESIREAIFGPQEGPVPLPPYTLGNPDISSPWLAADTETSTLDTEHIDPGYVVAQLGDGHTANLYLHHQGLPTQPGQHLWLHNAKYDAPRLGVGLSDLDSWDDTMLVAYVLRRPRVGLKALALAEFGYVMTEIKDVLRVPVEVTLKNGKTRTKMQEVGFDQALELSPDKARAYALDDAHVTSHLARKLWPELANDGRLAAYYYEYEKPMVPILYRMEKRGVRIDLPALGPLDESLRSQQEEHESTLRDLLDAPTLNIASNQELAAALLKSGLELTEKTPTGQLKTDKEALLKLAGVSDYDDLLGTSYAQVVVREVLLARQVAKLRSTYVDGLRNRADGDNRIHTQLNQAVTATNRLSSSKPNLQNIPVRGSIVGKQLRRIFIPRRGNVLLKADCSQLEVRIYAHYTRERILVDAYTHTDHNTSGRDGSCSRCDVHQRIADAAGVPRWRAKNGFFGRIYGCSDEKFASTCGVPLDRVAPFLKELSRELPSLAGGWHRNTRLELERLGYLETWMGWRGYYPQYWSPMPSDQAAALREAGNFRIQGTASGFVKQLIIEVERIAPRYDAEFLLTVHDEVVYELPDDRDRTRAFARELQESCLALSTRLLTIPVLLEVSAGPSWGDTIPV